LTGQEIET